MLTSFSSLSVRFKDIKDRNVWGEIGMSFPLNANTIHDLDGVVRVKILLLL